MYTYMITEKSDTCCCGHLNKQKVGNHTYMYRCMKRNGDLQRGTFSCSLVLLVLDNVGYMCTVKTLQDTNIVEQGCL